MVGGGGVRGRTRTSTWGTRTSQKVLEDGSKWPFKTHRWNEWIQTDKDESNVQLNVTLRGKMGRAVVKFFEGEQTRKGMLRYLKTYFSIYHRRYASSMGTMPFLP